WQLTVILVAAMLLLFGYVAWQARTVQDYAPIQKKFNFLRTGLFVGLVLLCTPVLVRSLADLPYAQNASGTAQIVRATGHQWYWVLSADRVEAGRPVEFHVTSADVNHGFALYDPELRVVAQTQAMPGYTNVLRHSFKEPGTYKVLCLEYCGLAHHAMTAEITVTPASGGGHDD
ncbi:MAG: hypothetical protein R3236_11175, partial [Phycisphaeraceae bacterium]|nr:hypothetical protein [Phycisphaeraceae bacterium]